MSNRFLYSKTINIVIVDDNSLFRNVVSKLLSTELQYNVIGDYSNDEIIKHKKFIQYADIILMDLQMPKMNGIFSASRWIEECPKAKIIAVSISTYYIYNRLLQEIGLKGCIFKDNFIDEIVPAIESVHSGGTYFNETLHASYINKLYYN